MGGSASRPDGGYCKVWRDLDGLASSAVLGIAVNLVREGSKAGCSV